MKELEDNEVNRGSIGRIEVGEKKGTSLGRWLIRRVY
jgi:hypothetical protein